MVWWKEAWHKPAPSGPWMFCHQTPRICGCTFSFIGDDLDTAVMPVKHNVTETVYWEKLQFLIDFISAAQRKLGSSACINQSRSVDRSSICCLDIVHCLFPLKKKKNQTTQQPHQQHYHSTLGLEISHTPPPAPSSVLQSPSLLTHLPVLLCR